MNRSRPNILLLVSDQERQRSWLPPTVRLPWRERLLAEGLEFTNYFTHSSPCSPSRASLMTGQYVPQHRVVDNVILPQHTELDPAIPTIGSLLHDEAYPEIFDALPSNFDDDLHTKPEAHRQWRWDQQHGLWGYIDPADTRAW